MGTSSKSPVRGRPRAFDADRALDSALRIFWEKGYEGTSMADLTTGMGINKPSLYAAFGNKEDLFRKVLERYQQGPAAFITEAVKAPTSREVVAQFLAMAAKALTGPDTPRGCLVVQSALSCADSADPVKQELIACRKGYEAMLSERFKRARQENDLPADLKPADLARYVATVHQGMAVQAAGGATRKELLGIVGTVLKAWPAA